MSRSASNRASARAVSFLVAFELPITPPEYCPRKFPGFEPRHEAYLPERTGKEPAVKEATASRGVSRSGQGLFPVVTFPLCLFVILVGEPNAQAPIFQAEPEMEIPAARLNSHPPLVIVHLFEMHRSTTGDNFIKGGPSIRQLALSSDLK